MSMVGEWLGSAEHKLDEWGRPGWIGAMVLGFILVWPLGLAILGYMIWSGRMGSGKDRRCGWGRRHATSGNEAFDAYRDATLKRLEEEQAAFRDFLGRLRRARDEAEFRQFVDERSRPDAPNTQPA